jgi:hypothetical protein
VAGVNELEALHGGAEARILLGKMAFGSLAHVRPG